MPIRKEMRAAYPPAKEWKLLRTRILERAGNACECRGECGLTHEGERCAAPNSKFVKRNTFEGVTHVYEHDGCSLCLGGDDECRPVLIVLTTAHLDHDPTHNDDSNLRALCQLCHLRYDRHEHAATRAAARARKQGGLF